MLLTKPSDTPVSTDWCRGRSHHWLPAAVSVPNADTVTGNPAADRCPPGGSSAGADTSAEVQVVRGRYTRQLDVARYVGAGGICPDKCARTANSGIVSEYYGVAPFA